MAGVRQSYPRLDFHPQWAIKFRGEKTPITASPGLDARTGRPLPEVPVSTVDVVIVGVSRQTSKRFYLSGWDPKKEGEAPDCFSTAGVAPDAAAQHPQSVACVTCTHNKWGSKVTDAGTKIKACQDRKKIAVVPAADIANEEFGGPMILDLPPTGRVALERYARDVRRHGTDPSQVVTTLGKDAQTIHQITFTVAGFIPDADDFELAMDLATSDEVRAMLEDETVEVMADIEGIAATEGHPLAHRPAHIAAHIEAEAAKPAPTPEPEVPPAPEPAPEPPPVQEPVTPPVTPPTAKRVSPFQQKAAAMATPRAETVSETPTTTVVKGAPAKMQHLIDNLLGC
jgi:hypothetical protein